MSELAARRQAAVRSLLALTKASPMALELLIEALRAAVEDPEVASTPTHGVVLSDYVFDTTHRLRQAVTELEALRRACEELDGQLDDELLNGGLRQFRKDFPLRRDEQGLDERLGLKENP